MNININDLLNVILRALISLVTLFLTTKIIGKKQVSQLTLFDYVIGISIGNFAAEMTINLDSEEFYGILAVFIFGFIAYLVSILTMKSMRLRRFFMGTPTILIQDGKIIESNLRKVKYDINDMLEQCRIKGYFDVSNISYAILENNGELSVLPKSSYRNVNLTDLNLKKEKESVCANVIIDGKIMYENLSEIKKDESWISDELLKQGYGLNEIILGMVNQNGKLILFEKNKNMKILDVLE